MKIQQILNKVNSFNPDKINFVYRDNYTCLEIYINKYIVFLEFKNNSKKGRCLITYLGNYFFSIDNKLHIIFEYMYLILNKEVTDNVYEIKNIPK